jgi:hypothetical protein
MKHHVWMRSKKAQQLHTRVPGSSDNSNPNHLFSNKKATS